VAHSLAYTSQEPVADSLRTFLASGDQRPMSRLCSAMQKVNGASSLDKDRSLFGRWTDIEPVPYLRRLTARLWTDEYSSGTPLATLTRLLGLISHRLLERPENLHLCSATCSNGRPARKNRAKSDNSATEQVVPSGYSMPEQLEELTKIRSNQRTAARWAGSNSLADKSVMDIHHWAAKPFDFLRPMSAGCSHMIVADPN